MRNVTHPVSVTIQVAITVLFVILELRPLVWKEAEGSIVGTMDGYEDGSKLGEVDG
jgi:hypothetical protein